MTFDHDSIETFLTEFDDTAPQIRRFEGCHRLELWRDADAPAVFTTYSHWEDAAALDRYRSSELFQSTWATVKPLFADRPEAHSYVVERSRDVIDQRSSPSTESRPAQNG